MRNVPIPGKYLDRVLSAAGIDLEAVDMPQATTDRWNEFEVLVDRFDTQIKKHIFFQGYFEWAETNFVRNSLRPGQTFVDVGANIGWHTLMAASRVGSSGRVVAIEPAASTFLELQSNVQLNRFRNVTMHQLGLSDREGSVEIFRNNEDDSGGNTMFRSADHVPLETVQARRGDDVLSEAGVEVIDLLKVDVEGAEMLVLRGLERFFSEGRIKSMMLEINAPQLRSAGASPQDLLDFVHANGFSVADIRSPEKLLITLPAEHTLMNIRCHKQRC
jgi:FkbM family methyltransferase